MAGFNRIGEILVARGLVSLEQLREALHDRNESYFRIGEILVAKGIVTEDDILDCLAQQYNYPVADLTRTRPSTDAMSLFTIEQLDASPMLPIYIRGNNLICAVPGPFDTAFYNKIESDFHLNIEFVLARANDIRSALHAYLCDVKEGELVDRLQDF